MSTEQPIEIGGVKVTDIAKSVATALHMSRTPPPMFSLCDDWFVFEHRVRNYLRWTTTSSQSSVVLSLLDDEPLRRAMRRGCHSDQPLEELMTELRLLLSRYESPTEPFSELRSRYQLPGEPLNDFICAIEDLVGRAFPNSPYKLWSEMAFYFALTGLRCEAAIRRYEHLWDEPDISKLHHALSNDSEAQIQVKSTISNKKQTVHTADRHQGENHQSQWSNINDDDLSECASPELRSPIRSNPSNEARHPNEEVGMVLMGPFPETRRGNKHILVIIDLFTKWGEARTIRNAKSSTIAREFMSGWIATFGVPIRLRTGGGSHFKGSALNRLCEELNIERSFALHFDQQDKDQVKRASAIVRASLRKTVEKYVSWDLAIPACLLAYRTSVNPSTGRTPAKMMMGRELRLPENFTEEDFADLCLASDWAEQSDDTEDPQEGSSTQSAKLTYKGPYYAAPRC